MQARAFKLLNASERVRLAGLAGAALAGWRQAWTAPAVAASGVDCAPVAEALALRATTDWLSFAAGAGTFYLADGGRALALVRAAIAGGAEDADPLENSMAADLVRAGLQDLAARLLGTPATGGAAGAAAAPPLELWLRGSGAARINLPLPDGDIVALLDAGLVAELLADLPAPARRAAPLTNPQLGIAGLPIQVQAWLGTTDIDLATFQTLAVNDVLLLDSRIDQPLRVTVAGRDAAPRAVLGHAEQQRAIRLTTYLPDH